MTQHAHGGQPVPPRIVPPAELAIDQSEREIPTARPSRPAYAEIDLEPTELRVRLGAEVVEIADPVRAHLACAKVEDENRHPSNPDHIAITDKLFDGYRQALGVGEGVSDTAVYAIAMRLREHVEDLGKGGARSSNSRR